MGIKIGYQNVWKGNKQQHAWLAECRQMEVDVIFVEECYIQKAGLGMINTIRCKVVIEVKARTRVVAYCKKGMGNVCSVRMHEVDEIGINWQGRTIMGVYVSRKSERGRRRYWQCVKKVANFW